MYQAAAIAAFAKMTIQDSRKIIPPSLYPSWVVFSQQQKLSYMTLKLLDDSQRIGPTMGPNIIKNDKINSYAPMCETSIRGL